MTIAIRAARPGDEDTMFALLFELAEYEKLTHVFHITPETIERDFFSPQPRCHCELLFDSGVPFGIANCWTGTSPRSSSTKASARVAPANG